MAEQNNEFLTVPATNGGDFSLLETGAYTGVCVGLTKKNFKKFKSENEVEPKFQFVFQIVGEDGTNHYLRTIPYRNVIADASKLFQFLNGWVGVTLEKASAGLDLGKLVGVKAQIVVGESERDGKTFNTIENVLKAKKNDSTEFVKDDKAPAFLNRGPFICSRWIEGLAFAAEAEESKVDLTDDDLVKAADEKKASATKKVDGKEFLNGTSEATEDEDAGLPF